MRKNVQKGLEKRNSQRSLLLFFFPFLLYSFSFFTLIPSAFSLGMSPGMETFFFQPNLTHSSEIKLIGESEPFDAKITVTGDMEQWVTVSTDTITVPPE